MTLAIPAFDIFSGRYGEKGVVWLGAVARLEDARTRMLNLAEKQPGAYFVFNSDTKALVASIDTSPPLRASESKKANGPPYPILGVRRPPATLISPVPPAA